MKKALSRFVYGMLIGACDALPGVSGGTIAFVIGIYETLLEKIAAINIRKPFSTIDWRFFSPFVFGIVTAFLLFSSLIFFLMQSESYRPLLFALFFGLVSGSILICVQKTDISKSRFFLCLGVMLAFFIPHIFKEHQKESYSVVLKERPTVQGVNYNAEKNILTNLSASTIYKMRQKGLVDESSTPADLLKQNEAYFFDIRLVVAGAFAASCMLLPGISGSYMLQVLGFYGPCLAALVDTMQGRADLSSILLLSQVFLGIVIGILGFSRLIRFFLKVYYRQTMALLIGFMAGSLSSIWPFYHYDLALDPLHPNQTVIIEKAYALPTFSVESIAVVVFFFVGFEVVKQAMRPLPVKNNFKH